MKIKAFMNLIEKHSDILKPFYSDYSVAMGFGGNKCELVDIFIHTKIKRPTKKLLADIKAIFKADDIDFIGSNFGKMSRCKKCFQWESVPFFSISYRMKKRCGR